MKTLHQHLKDSTQNLHRQLDQHPIFSSLLSTEVTASSIRQALEFWWGFHHAVEVATCQPKFDSWKSFLEARHKLAALKIDMERFCAAPCPTPFCWPDVNSIADFMALLYITEGSMLGGLAIQKILQKNVRTYPAHLNFLTLYEPNTLVHWKEFLMMLEDASTHFTHADAGKAAITWFSSLIAYADQIYFCQSNYNFTLRDVTAQLD